MILRNSTDGLAASRVRVGFGGSAYWGVAGEWDGDGDDTAGVFKPGDQTCKLINTAT